MDIIFDARAAEELIRQMDMYCTGIVQETRALRDTVENSGRWNDLQGEAFENNVEALAKDLNKALSLESEYMKTYQQRVSELRG